MFKPTFINQNYFIMGTMDTNCYPCQLALVLAANLVLASGSKKNKMAIAKMQTGGFKMAVHKLMGDVMDTKSIIYTVYGSNLTLILVTPRSSVFN